MDPVLYLFLGTLVPLYELNPVRPPGCLSGTVIYRLPISRATEFIQSEKSIMDSLTFNDISLDYKSLKSSLGLWPSIVRVQDTTVPTAAF